MPIFEELNENVPLEDRESRKVEEIKRASSTDTPKAPKPSSSVSLATYSRTMSIIRGLIVVVALLLVAYAVYFGVNLFLGKSGG